AAIDASINAATCEVNTDERAAAVGIWRAAVVLMRVGCAGSHRGNVELEVARVVHVLSVCRFQIEGMSRRMVSLAGGTDSAAEASKLSRSPASLTSARFTRTLCDAHRIVAMASSAHTARSEIRNLLTAGTRPSQSSSTASAVTLIA